MIKKIVAVITGFGLLVSLNACGQEDADRIVTNNSETTQQTQEETDTTEETTSESETQTQETGNSSESVSAGNVLIAYFTLPETDGTDTSSSASRVEIDGEVKGSTQVIAEMIQETTGGELFKIETVQEYPGSHEPLVDQAANEQEQGARPELASSIEGIETYDTIYLGFPNWWADMPMPLYTFLEQYDLSGKTIIPFTTHGGSSFSSTISTISELQPNATVIEEGLSISRNADIAGAQSDVDSWLQEVGTR